MIGLPYAKDAFVIYTTKDCCKTKAFIKKLEENEIKYYIHECDEELENNYNEFSFFLREFANRLNCDRVEVDYLPMFFYDGEYEPEPYNCLNYIIAEKFDVGDHIFYDGISGYGFTILSDRNSITYCEEKKIELDDFYIECKIINCDELDMDKREALNCFLKKVVEEDNITLPISFYRFGYIKSVEDYITKLRMKREERNKKYKKGLITFEIDFKEILKKKI
jgi:hypothetical protein